MTALRIVQVVVSLSFLALGVFTVVDWLRHRGRSRGYLALALGTLGLTSVLGQVNTLTGQVAAAVIGPLSVALFMVSGYALLLFRNTFIPLPRAVRIGAAAAGGIVLIAYLASGYPTTTAIRPTALQSAIVMALVLVWSATVLEPVVRFWLASGKRPAVQRARLRALAAGYAAIVVILLVAVLGGGSLSTSTIGSWFFEIIAIIALPLLLVSFAPPIWLRRIWRQGEVDRLRDALHELVLFSPDRKTLAKRAADWAMRLVGAEGAAIVDADGSIMVASGLDDAVAIELARRVQPDRPSLLAKPGSEREDAIVLPLRMDAGVGSLVVVSGPFTPFFGSEEVAQLRAYTVNVVAALDRARVTERLAALDRMKSQFLNLASHELRSPLGVISGYLSMLEQGALGQLKEQGVRAIEVLKAKTMEMNLLVSQLLDAARLEEGKLALQRKNLDLRDLAEQAIEVVRPMANARHQLSVDLPSTEIPIFGDRDRLLNIVTNLIENALKYSPDGGEVQLALASVDGTATLTVRDQGIGISEQDLPRLFNRFERLHNPRTSHVGGTGLGLYLARELARQHGGDIEVSSEAGEGSSFRLTLPLARPVGASAATAEPAEGLPAAAVPQLHVVDGEYEKTQSA